MNAQVHVIVQVIIVCGKKDICMNQAEEALPVFMVTIIIIIIIIIMISFTLL